MRSIFIGMTALMASMTWLWAQAKGPDVESQDSAVIAARINGEPLYALSVEMMTWLKRTKQPQTSRAQVLEMLIDNRLLAAKARHLFKPDELHPATRVAFARDVALDDQLIAALRARYAQQIEAALKALPGATLTGLVTQETRPTPAVLNAVLGESDKLQLSYAITPEQAAFAKRIVLLRYRLSGRPGEVTLYDVYHRQNVQGRVELFNRNLDFLTQQAKVALANRFVLDWARQKFGARALEDLRHTLTDQDDVQALLELHGIGHDIDAQSAILSQFAQQVSADEIAAYYHAHKNEFKRIERVKARHIRINDEALANQVSVAARHEDFGALAQRYSIADDAKSGGDLGWIVHHDKLSWLEALAYTQPQGEVSRPIRMPADPTDAPVWEIILIEQRIEGYQMPQSEAVRYVAGNAIAREKAVKRIDALRAQALHGARIEISDLSNSSRQEKS